MSASINELREMYRTMARIRACDELIRKGISKGRLTCFYFPVTGHEAIATGIHHALEKDDNLVITYRGLHHQVARGVPFDQLLGEYTGKSTGFAGGRGGQMHICDPEVGLMLTTGIVGGGLPPAVGLAWAAKIRGDGKVTVCCFGDGAINSGSFHESMNMAAVFDLPVIFMCENNFFAETIETKDTFRGTITGRAASYGMPAETVDGYDPEAVRACVLKAAEQARTGNGPYFIEATCFRFHGHFLGDPMPAVPPERLEAERKRDPFTAFTRRLIAGGEFTEEELSSIKSAADEAAGKVEKATLAADYPAPESLMAPIYASKTMGER